MREIQTVLDSDEQCFDQRVNALLAEGWTFHGTPYMAHEAGAPSLRRGESVTLVMVFCQIMIRSVHDPVEA